MGGIWKFYDNNNKLLSVKNYLNGTLDGLQKEFNPTNGKLTRKYYYKNGIELK